MCDMCIICDMCNMYDKCTYGSRVTCVTHIARKARVTSRTHIPHRICITVNARTSLKDTSGIALVRSCWDAGVATGDGRHQPIPTGQEALELADGCAIHGASVQRTPAVPAQRGYGKKNGVCHVSPRPVRTVSLVRVVIDEPPPGADGNRFESIPWTVGTAAAYRRSKCTSCNTKTPLFVFHEGRVRGSRSPNPTLAFRPWPLASSQPDRAEGRKGIRRGPGYAARHIPPTTQKRNNHRYGKR